LEWEKPESRKRQAEVGPDFLSSRFGGVSEGESGNQELSAQAVCFQPFPLSACNGLECGKPESGKRQAEAGPDFPSSRFGSVSEGESGNQELRDQAVCFQLFLLSTFNELKMGEVGSKDGAGSAASSSRIPLAAILGGGVSLAA
jgi:hypothetical protein